MVIALAVATMASDSTRQSGGVGIWGGGLVGGLLGGIGMGIVLHFGANQIELLGTFVGRPTVLGGWIAHLTFSVLFGLAFAAIVSSRPFRRTGETFAGYVGLGFTYGVLLGFFAGGLLLPLALSRAGAVTYPTPFLPVPGVGSEMVFALLLTGAHLVYGVVLGGVYATINGIGPGTTVERESPLEP